MNKIHLHYTHEDAVANVILDDKKGNVLDKIMMADLLECFEEFRKKKNLKLIVFEGEGKHFSFGASVEEHTKDFAQEMIGTFHKLFTTLTELSIPTLSKVSGQCLGGGMELAIFCNFIFADKSAIFGQPEIVLGVIAPPASIMLPLKVGNARAEDFLISGRPFNAKVARKIGLVNKLFSDRKEMNTGVEDWIHQIILPKSASSLRYAVKCARTTFNEDLLNKLPQLETIYLNNLMNTKDANEGISAFIDKRQPVWENC